MSKLIVTREDYLKYPDALSDAVRDFLVIIKDNLPDVLEAAQSKIPPALTFMDHRYKLWIKREVKRKGCVKKRHIHKVSDSFLKHAQDYVQRMFHLPSSECVYSYKPGMSTKTCASKHVGGFALFKLDISDFFPSITRTMILRMYEKYFEDLWANCKDSLKKNQITRDSLMELPRIIAILCTRSDTRENGNTTEPILPIGIEPAATISNHVLIEVDTLLQQQCASRQLVYSRYSDNIFISSMNGAHIDREFQEEVKKMIDEFDFEGTRPFKVNARKTRYSPLWRSQRMLGVIVNIKVNVPKEREAWLRSALNHLYHDVKQLYDTLVARGTDVKTLTTSYGKLYRRAQRVFGQLSYVSSVRKEKYYRYSAQHHAIKLLLEETQLELNVYTEEVAATAGSKAKAKKGGAS